MTKDEKPYTAERMGDKFTISGPDGCYGIFDKEEAEQWAAILSLVYDTGVESVTSRFCHCPVCISHRGMTEEEQ